MPLLDREEYIEQAYFFRTFHERLDESLPSQEILSSIREEILATTKLPLALDVLRDELMHKGKICEGMAHLSHYFAPFQAFVMDRAEEDRSKFDQRIAFQHFIVTVRQHLRDARQSNEPVLTRVWEEVAKPTPDQQLINQLVAQVDQNRTTFQKAAAGALTTFIASLTPEQRAKLASLAQGHHTPAERHLWYMIVP